VCDKAKGKLAGEEICGETRKERGCRRKVSDLRPTPRSFVERGQYSQAFARERLFALAAKQLPSLPRLVMKQGTEENLFSHRYTHDVLKTAKGTVESKVILFK